MERNVGGIVKTVDKARSGRSVKGLSTPWSGVDEMEIRGIGGYAEVWP